MTSVHLIQTMKSMVEEALQNIELSDGQKPRVFIGWLPAKEVPDPQPGIEPERRQKARQPESRFPFVIIRTTEGNELNDDAVCKVKMGFGSYDNDESYQGYIDIANMIERVKQKMLSVGILAGRYELSPTDRIVWKIYDEQPWPLFEGEMSSTWTMPGISREVDYGD